MKLTIAIEQDEDGIYIASVAEMHGCRSDGDTITQALRNIAEAIEQMREFAAAAGGG